MTAFTIEDLTLIRRSLEVAIANGTLGRDASNSATTLHSRIAAIIRNSQAAVAYDTCVECDKEDRVDNLHQVDRLLYCEDHCPTCYGE